jgi:cytosine/adenosine deaminase-related metal-dependent hydrolase
VADGGVLVHDGRVVRVGRFADLAREGARVQDLGDVALLPGLVNAHAHLDLTGARHRFAPTTDFVGWIRGLRPFREAEGPGAPARAAEEGARELLAGGCTLVGDTVHDPSSLEGLRRSGIRAVAAYEILELGPAFAHRPLHGARGHLDAHPEGEEILPGLAPHTPYTCSPGILRDATALARERGVVLALHLAETEAEVEFLLRNEGALAAILAPLLPEGWAAPGLRPAHYLRGLGLLEGPILLAHGNHLDAEEAALVRDAGAVVVHCPGSHAFFSHGRHPVRDLLAAGVTVALGTDSLASHPEGALSMTGEIRRLAALEPGIPPRDLLAMATVHGAEGLGLAGRAGVLAPGSFADAAAFAAPGGWKGPESILDPGLRCTAALVGGVLRHGTPGA